MHPSHPVVPPSDWLQVLQGIRSALAHGLSPEAAAQGLPPLSDEARPLAPRHQVAQELFEILRKGRARLAGHVLEQVGLLPALLPLLPHEQEAPGSQVLNWLGALDRWTYEEGNLSPLLLFASRVWWAWRALSTTSVSCPRADVAQQLASAALPLLRDAPTPVRQVVEIVNGQAALDAGDSARWAQWPAPLRAECLRLLKWREMLGECPAGHAAVCLAKVRTPSSLPPMEPHRSLGTWRYGGPALVRSIGDPAAPEQVLIGHRVRRVAEPAETVVACLAMYLLLQGHSVDTLHLEAELPISNEGVSLRDWTKLCRRVGLVTEAVSLPALLAAQLPALCRLRDGSCLLLLEANPDHVRAFVPGAKLSFRWLDRQSLVSAAPEFVCSVKGVGQPRRFMRPVRALRFEGLNALKYQGRLTDGHELLALSAEFQAWPSLSFEPPHLTEPSLTALLEGHRSLAAPGSPFHGRFRQVDLRRTSAFLAWEQIPLAMDELLGQVAALPPSGDGGILAPQLARLLMDFLRIHPFLDGNRRMAMGFGSAICHQQGFRLDWSQLSRVQLYYGVRCAAAGHPQPFVSALRRALAPSTW